MNKVMVKWGAVQCSGVQCSEVQWSREFPRPHAGIFLYGAPYRTVLNSVQHYIISVQFTLSHIIAVQLSNPQIPTAWDSLNVLQLKFGSLWSNKEKLHAVQ